MYSLNDGKMANVGVLNTDDNKVYASSGDFGYVCQSCAQDTFECPTICSACENEDGKTFSHIFLLLAKANTV